MNKSYLIVGGASAVSLAVGGTAGYLVAKRRFNAIIETRIDEEVNKTKKHYSVLLMEAKQGKPDSPEDISLSDDEEENDDLTPEDEEVVAKGRETLGRAAKALTDYQGISSRQMSDAGKPPLEDIGGNRNIFSDAASRPKKVLPPREPGTGKFLPKAKTEETPEREKTPYIITHEEFLLGDLDFEQENLRWFVNDQTLIQVFDNEVVEIDRVGEVNLTLFPETAEDEPSIICVRNEWLQMDYEIQSTKESLTEYMGLSTENDDSEEDTVVDSDDDGEEDDESMSRTSRWADAMQEARRAGER